MSRIALAAVTGIVLAAAAIFGAYAAATSDGSSPSLSVQDDSGFDGTGNLDTPVGVTYVHGTLVPCLTRPGAVTITGFGFASGSGLVLTGWGSRPNPFTTGAGQTSGAHGTIAGNGFTPGAGRVSNLCDDPHDLGREFAIAYHRTGTATGWAVGLVVTYRQGGSEHAARWTHVGFALCGTTPIPDKQMATLCT